MSNRPRTPFVGALPEWAVTVDQARTILPELMGSNDGPWSRPRVMRFLTRKEHRPHVDIYWQYMHHRGLVRLNPSDPLPGHGRAVLDKRQLPKFIAWFKENATICRACGAYSYRNT